MSERTTGIRINTTADTRGFREVERAAGQMGQSVEQAGQRAGRGLSALRMSAADFGAAMGTGITAASFLGRAYVQQEQQVRGLTIAYGAAAGELLTFARQLQQTTVYSDDAARAAILNASTITREYGLATDKVDDLVQRAADLASIYGFDLADASARLTAAIRGEAEAAEALGIAMADTALQQEAARLGLEGWTTTMTEAEKAQVRYQVLMQQTAYAQGAAAQAAETHAGQAQQLVNRLQDIAQAAGGALGPLGEYTAVLGHLALAAPLAGAGIAKLAGALGLLGLGGAGILGAGAFAAGSGVFAYDLLASGQRAGGSTSENALARFFGGAAGFLGFESVQDQFKGIVSSNKFEEAGRLLLAGNETDPDIIYNRLRLMYGYAPGVMSDKDLRAKVEAQAAAQGLTVGQYLAGAAPAAGFVFDSATGRYLPRDVYTPIQQARVIAGATPGQGDVYGTGGAPLASTPATPADPFGDYRTLTGRPRTPFDTEHTLGYTYRDYGSAGVAMGSLVAGGMPEFPELRAEAYANTLALIRREVEQTYPAFAGMVAGIDSANDALSAFKGTQDLLLGDIGVYQQQHSEYSGVLNALTAGYEILQQRQAEGVALTEAEQELLANYPGYYERLTGGQEDATVAAALLAAQYAENMEIGDQMNRTLAGTNDVLGTLAEALTLYIMTLEGVPAEVKTEIRLNTDPALSALYAFLNRIPSSLTVPMYVTGTQILGFLGGRRHGGIAGYADGGVVARLAEAGPELLRFRDGGSAWAVDDGLYAVPRGTYVTPAPASRGQGRAGPSIVISGPVTVVANDPRQFAAALAEYARGGARL